MKVKMQAREIMRASKRLNIPLKKGAYHSCALGVFGRANGIERTQLFSTSISKILKISTKNLDALELGFENWSRDSSLYREEYYYELKKNRYFKVGRRVAELAGLS